MNLEFFRQNAAILNFMKTCPEGTEFHSFFKVPKNVYMTQYKSF
jgi:hypothetical protein